MSYQLRRDIMSRPVAAFVHGLISPAVDDWFVKQCIDPSVAFYVYYRKTDGITPGAFLLAENAPSEDWIPVTQDRVRIDQTKQQVQCWLYELSRTLEILPYDLELAG